MQSDSTVVITGGTGFIGAYTAADLVKRGTDVVLFDINPNERLREKLGIEDVPFVRGDLTEPTRFYECLEETEASHIIHLASLLTTRTRADPRLALDVNVCGTNTVFEAARQLNDQIERIAWASSSAVYPPPTYATACDEGSKRSDERNLDETDVQPPASLYGAAKRYNEYQARVYQEEYSVSHVGLRPTLVYGPYRESGSATTYAKLIEKPARGKPVEIGPQTGVLDWQHVEDVSQAFRKATFAPDSSLSRRVYNVCGVQATLQDVANAVREVVPDASITLTDDGKIPWTHALSDRDARADLKYEPAYDLERGVRTYIETVSREAEMAE